MYSCNSSLYIHVLIQFISYIVIAPSKSKEVKEKRSDRWREFQECFTSSSRGSSSTNHQNGLQEDALPYVWAKRRYITRFHWNFWNAKISKICFETKSFSGCDSVKLLCSQEDVDEVLDQVKAEHEGAKRMSQRKRQRDYHTASVDFN